MMDIKRAHSPLLMTVARLSVPLLLMATAGGLPAQDAPAPAPAANEDGSFDLRQLETRLKADGLEGWIHGAVDRHGLYVFTYRDPKDFFRAAEFPMVAGSPEVGKRLRELNRHDRVRVKGAFIANRAPVRHLMVTDIQPVKPWKPEGGALSPASRNAASDRLAKSGALTARVHAVGEEGRMLVIDHRGRIVPVFVPDPGLTRALYRGDLIRLRYVSQSDPRRPLHLNPDPKSKQPIEVLSRIAEGHGKPATLEGVLVRYPRSPQISIDVYAVQVADPEGSSLDYTLVNFKDPEVFGRVRKKMEAVWEAHRVSAREGRNRQVNPKVRLRVKGTLNIQSPRQANPQILLDSEDDVEVMTAR